MYEEFETTAFIRKILTEEGIEILDLPLKTGLVARISGSKPGKKNRLPRRHRRPST